MPSTPSITRVAMRASVARSHPVTDNRASRARNATMPDILTLYAQAQPDKLSLVDDRPDGTVTTLTFSEMNALANRLVNVLLAHGARPGASKIVWCGMNSIGVVTLVHAARKLGITAVPLNYR